MCDVSGVVRGSRGITVLYHCFFWIKLPLYHSFLKAVTVFPLWQKKWNTILLIRFYRYGASLQMLGLHNWLDLYWTGISMFCCRKKMNPNRNHSRVAWDCYYRPCPDDPSAAVSPSPQAASVADAEQSCATEQQEQEQSCPRMPEAVPDDGHQQIVVHAVCNHTVLH